MHFLCHFYSFITAAGNTRCKFRWTSNLRLLCSPRITTTTTAPIMLSPRVLLRSRPLRQVAYFTTSKPKPADTTATTTSTTAKPAAAANGFNATKPAARPAYSAPAAKTRPQMSIPQHLVYTPSTISHSSSAEASDSDIATINWASSFHGISSKPVTEEQFKVLMQPLNERDIEVKPDGIIYLPEIKYRRRLNEAFGPMGWGLIPKGEAVIGDNIVTREYALIVDGR